MRSMRKRCGVIGLTGLALLGVTLGGCVSKSTTVSGREAPYLTVSSPNLEKKSQNSTLKMQNYDFTDEELAEMAYYDELDEFACAVFAEAGNQGKKGMALVADVILNRRDSEAFPDTLHDVINQPGQFEVVSNGSINRVSPSDECFEVIREELANRGNTEVVFFRTDRYSDYGSPAFKYKDHYFSVWR